MSSVPSLKSLSKQAIFKNPKLKIDDPYDLGNCKGILESALDINEAVLIIGNTLEKAKKITLKFDRTNLGSMASTNDKKFKIIFGNEDKYYNIKASKDEVDEKFLKYFNPEELKKIGEKFTQDQILVHEFYHILNNCIDPNYLKVSETPSSKRDMHTIEEERTIENGENSYLKALKRPERVDHLNSEFPPYTKMLNKSKEGQKRAFAYYLGAGCHVDALNLSEKLTKEEIEEILTSYSPQIDSWGRLHIRAFSENFLDILFALIEERGLKIDFSDPKYNDLYNICLMNIHTKDQSVNLQNLKDNNLTDKTSTSKTDLELLAIHKNNTDQLIKVALIDNYFDILKVQNS